MIHEDTLAAIEYVCEQLEENCTKEQDSIGDYPNYKACIECKEEDTRRYWSEEVPHKPDCKLIAQIKMLRAFVIVERKLIEELNV
jgi:hypothetical protein